VTFSAEKAPAKSPFQDRASHNRKPHIIVDRTQDICDSNFALASSNFPPSSRVPLTTFDVSERNPYRPGSLIADLDTWGLLGSSTGAAVRLVIAALRRRGRGICDQASDHYKQADPRHFHLALPQITAKAVRLVLRLKVGR
jgi:hypothetical protein